MAAGPLGATWKDTGEYLLGKVAVTTVLLESNGQIDTESQDWTSAEILESIEKVETGVNWWSGVLDTLDTVHELEFVFDHTHAETPFETRYEPIDRSSHDQSRYVGEFLLAQGVVGGSSLENAMWRFNDSQREAMNADWAFTIFIVDSSSDADGLFAEGGFPGAFALPGGLHMVVPSGRPESTISHEMGHIFWAFDEYADGASYHASRGYYDAQNLNATEDNPDLSQRQNSIMSSGSLLFNAYRNFTSAESTLALVGWQDSDGDGVFDVLDVPLNLDAIGHFDPDTSEYRLTGVANAVALHNLNSYGENPSVVGTNSDITLNRIDEIQYRLDEGDWITAAAPDKQVVDFDLSFTLSEAFDSIQWRAIDLTTGMTSAILSGTSTVPAIPAANQSGFAYLDENGNGQRDAGEPALSETTVTVRNPDGSALFHGSVDAADFSGPLPDLQGVSLTVEGSPDVFGRTFDPTLYALDSQAAGLRVFQAQEMTNGVADVGGNRDRWVRREFVATFDQNVGVVSVDMIGLDETSFGRVEAYDAAGNLITRVTEEIARGDVKSLRVSDPQAAIASIRAFSLVHTDTAVAISRIDFGFTDQVTTDAAGSWRFPDLPVGDYIAELTPPLLIHQFDQAGLNIQISQGAGTVVAAAAIRVDSPRYNAALPFDANGDGKVSASDALVVINDLARHSSRILGPGEAVGFDVDVSNDGSATALDALLVINHLSRSPNGGEPEATAAFDTVLIDPIVSDSVEPFGADSDPSPRDSDPSDAIFASWPIGPAVSIAKTGSSSPFSLTEQKLSDSAGGTTLDESDDPNRADTPYRRIDGEGEAAKERIFPLIPVQQTREGKVGGVKENVNLDEDSLNFGFFRSYFSEPL